MSLPFTGFIALFIGSESGWSDLSVGAYGVLLAATGATVIGAVVYGVAFMFAPKKQRDETRSALLQQSDDQEYDQLLYELAALREEGVKLRNEGPARNTEKEIEFWTTSWELWRGNVIGRIEKISRVEGRLFQTLDWFDAPEFGIRDPQHHLNVRILHAELRNLKIFIDAKLPVSRQ